MHDFSEHSDDGNASQPSRQRTLRTQNEEDQRMTGARLLQEFGLVIVIPLFAALIVNLLLRLAWQ